MESIESSVRDLTSAFQEFKEKNDSRFRSLEKSRLSSKRPDVSYDADHLDETDLEHKNAFRSYIRKGDESGLLSLDCTKSLSVGSEADGGFLIPQVISEHLNQDLEIISPFRRLANVISISSSAVDVLLDKGNAEAGWAAETADRAETETPKLSKKRIPVHELFARPRATQKLLDDAEINTESWLANKIAHRMSQLENEAFISGDGNDKPKGFLSYQTALKDDLGENQIEHFMTGKNGAFGDDSPVDILVEAMSALPAKYLKEASWVVSKSAHAALRKLKDADGLSLWQPALTEGARETLMGYPVVIVDGMPELVSGNASKSIVFGNFREAYQIVDRAGTYVLRDPYSAKPYVEFYTVKRVGGDVINFEALKVINFSE